MTQNFLQWAIGSRAALVAIAKLSEHMLEAGSHSSIFRESISKLRKLRVEEL